MQLLNVLCKV